MSLAAEGGTPGVASAATPAGAAARYRRLAWLALGVGFTVFCLLCVSGLYGLFYYSQHAEEPNTAHLELAHGTKLEVRRAGQKAWNVVPLTTTLLEGDSVRTGQDTDALITLFDGSIVQLYYSTTVTLGHMWNSRFLDQFKDMRLEQDGGTVKVAAAAMAPYAAMKLQVISPDDEIVVSVPESSVTLITIPDAPTNNLRMTVSGYLGRTLVNTPAASQQISLGEMCRVYADGTILGPTLAATELIDNGSFVQPKNNPNTELAAGWRITVLPAEPPSPPVETRVLSETLSGRFVARISRGEAPGGEAPPDLVQVVLRQEMDAPVNFYQSLTFKATVQVAAQTFVGQGLYPLALRITYVDAEGKGGFWERDFYIRSSSFLPGTTTVPLDAAVWWPPPDRDEGWDLMAQAPAPARIRAVEVIVTGRTFNVSVTDLSLIGH